ncbi:MAG TPA: hypothetical protein VGQ29_06605 [Gemmatimonadales bacterium]|jgi:hypothetical protein|nr:hypothetical protein [Gemmatimonadales bacterium]
MRRILTALVLLLGAAGVSRAAAQRSHFGVHGGYNIDSDDWLIGAQVHLPLTRSIELYPSFDYYFVDPGSLVGLNADLQFRTPGAPLYFGGGLNILRASGNSDTGFDLFGGLETRYGRTHPYVEARGLFHDTSSLQLVFGLNVTLY